MKQTDTIVQYAKAKLAESQISQRNPRGDRRTGPLPLEDQPAIFEAIMPGGKKQKIAGIDITYGFGPSPFGDCLLAKTRIGICFLGFVQNDDQADILDQLVQSWPQARFSKNSSLIFPLFDQIFKRPPFPPLKLHLRGTNFQIQVWQALLTIPFGNLVSYSQVAVLIGHPSAHRAAANAIAANPVSFLVPCHRVITKSGKIHRYRWGASRKKAMIGWEASNLAGLTDLDEPPCSR